MADIVLDVRVRKELGTEFLALWIGRLVRSSIDDLGRESQAHRTKFKTRDRFS